jgi:predicted DNA-binding protein (MmcQ/YjbR family)
MTLTRLRDLCMSLPGATEQIQWGKDLVFKVGGKMFCVTCTDLDPSHEVIASFKCDDETFASLVEREGIIPAPYLARAKWVGLRSFDALDEAEYKELVPRAHAIVAATLSKKAQAALAGSGGAPRARRARSARTSAKRGKKTSAVRRKRA